MVLAICINSAFSDGLLTQGEYYMLDLDHREESRHCEARTAIAYQLQDSELISENFQLSGTCWTENCDLGRLKDRKGTEHAAHRFEILFSEAQFKVALHRASERAAYTSGSYKK